TPLNVLAPSGAVDSPTGSTLAVADETHVVLYDPVTLRPLGPPIDVPPGPSIGVTVPARLAFSPDGRVIAVGSLAGTVHRFSVATLSPVGGPIRVDGAPTSLAFSPDGSLLAVGSANATISLVDSTTGALRASMPTRFT